LGVGEAHTSVYSSKIFENETPLLAGVFALLIGRDPCAEKSDRGGCAVVDGAMEVEAAGLDLKDERESPASLVVIFYKKKT
jgi:hypothetical protein